MHRAFWYRLTMAADGKTEYRMSTLHFRVLHSSACGIQIGKFMISSLTTV